MSDKHKGPYQELVDYLLAFVPANGQQSEWKAQALAGFDTNTDDGGSNPKVPPPPPPPGH